MSASAVRNMLNVFIDKTREEGLAAFHRVAREERDRVLAQQTQRAFIRPDVTTIADGRVDAPIEAARSVVVHVFAYWREIVAQALYLLEGRAPRVTGKYLGSFSVYADGVSVPLQQIPRSFSELVIAPAVPYARRLEVGKRPDGRPFVKQVPPRIVDSVTQQLRKKYGRIALIKTEFRALQGASGTRASRQQRRARGRRSARELTFPSIVIRPL